MNETLWYIIIISSMVWIFLAIGLTLHFDEQIFMCLIGGMFIHLTLLFIKTAKKNPQKKL